MPIARISSTTLPSRRALPPISPWNLALDSSLGRHANMEWKSGPDTFFVMAAFPPFNFFSFFDYPCLTCLGSGTLEGTTLLGPDMPGHWRLVHCISCLFSTLWTYRMRPTPTWTELVFLSLISFVDFLSCLAWTPRPRPWIMCF